MHVLHLPFVAVLLCAWPACKCMMLYEIKSLCVCTNALLKRHYIRLLHKKMHVLSEKLRLVWLGMTIHDNPVKIFELCNVIILKDLHSLQDFLQ